MVKKNWLSTTKTGFGLNFNTFCGKVHHIHKKYTIIDSYVSTAGGANFWAAVKLTYRRHHHLRRHLPHPNRHLGKKKSNFDSFIFHRFKIDICQILFFHGGVQKLRDTQRGDWGI